MRTLRTAAVGIAIGLILIFAMRAEAAEWRRYADPTFGMEITYPADILTGIEKTANGARFTGAGASLEVSGIRNDSVRTPAALRALIQNTPGYEHASYNAHGSRWLVISGYRGADIFYEKFFLVGGTVQGFSITYPASARRPFDAIVERIEKRFRPGHS